MRLRLKFFSRLVSVSFFATLNSINIDCDGVKVVRPVCL